MAMLVGAGSRLCPAFEVSAALLQLCALESIQDYSEDFSMRMISLILSLTLLAGCSRITADYHLDSAYKAYEKGECGRALLELSQAERNIRSRPYLQPEISLLRGQCLERDKLYVDAAQTYRFVLQNYPRSEYAFRAQARLDTLEQLGHLREPAAKPVAIGL